MPGLRLAPRLLLLALALALSPLTVGCGSNGGNPVPLDGGSTVDLGRAVDASVPVDQSVPPDLAAPPEDLTQPPAPDLAMGKCAMVGDWLFQGMFVITLTAKGELVAMGATLGHFTFVGRTLTLTDDSSPECMMEGKYDVTFSNDCSEATLKSLGDPCFDREDALSGQIWVRQ